MAKNKTKGKKGAKRAGTKKQKAARTSTSMVMNPRTDSRLMKAVCSFTDPFCVASVGSRWPDVSSSPTIPIRVDCLHTITTNAAGTAAVTFTPSFPYGILLATVAGTTATNLANYADYDPNLTAFLAANALQYRVVSFGIEVIPVVATMTNQGYFIVAEVPGRRPPGNAYVTPSTTYPNVIVSNLVGDKVAFISRPQGNSSFDMTNMNTTTTYNETWSSVTVMVSGANPSSTVLMVRIRANLEYESLNANIYGTTAKPSQSNNFLTDIVSRVRANMEPIIKGGAEAAEKKVMSWAADALMRAGGSALGYYLGGPAGGAAGGAIAGQASHMIMDVD